MASTRTMAVVACCSMAVAACAGGTDPSVDQAAASDTMPAPVTDETTTALSTQSTRPAATVIDLDGADEATEQVAVGDTAPPPITVETTTALSAQPTRPAAAVIDLDVRHQSIDGFGVSTRVWSDPHLSDSPRTDVPAGAQDEILTLLLDDLGLTRMRPIIEWGIELENDNDDADVLNPAGFNFEGKRTDAHIDLIGQARARDLPIWFPSMLIPEPWMTEAVPDEYVERIMAQLFRWQQMDALPPMISPLNEPTLDAAGGFSTEWFVAVVRELGRRIDEAGLDTQLIIPDDVNPDGGIAFAEAVMADAEARPYVAALAYHLYGGSETARQRFVELSGQYDVPLWMTEYSRAEWDSWPAVLEWAAIVHELLVSNSIGAVDYMWGFFGSYQRGHALVSIDFADGQYRSHEPTAAYWVTGQWSRFVRPGSVRAEVTAPHDAELSAFLAADEREVVIVAVNRSESAVVVPVELAGASIGGTIRRIRSSPTEQWSETPVERSSVSGFQGELGPQSVSTFVVPIRP